MEGEGGGKEGEGGGDLVSRFRAGREQIPASYVKVHTATCEVICQSQFLISNSQFRMRANITLLLVRWLISPIDAHLPSSMSQVQGDDEERGCWR